VKITIVTPAKKGSLSGNRATAVRWARILRNLGHRTPILTDYAGEASDALLAIHAWRSAGAISRFRADHPAKPVILCLGGTDIYRFQKSHPEDTRRSMELADAIVCLHDLVYRAVPVGMRDKLHVIRQSVKPMPRRQPPRKRSFDLIVVGHLRDEKDPMRAALAVRRLPADSKIRILHLGGAHDDGWAQEAEREMARNPRYHWRGEVPHWAVRRWMTRARAMVLSSRMEGGANVVSEAIAAGLPVLGSKIDGNVGLLGTEYPGYFPVEDDAALSALMLRTERDPAFLETLRRCCAAEAPKFSQEAELTAWRDLIDRISR